MGEVNFKRVTACGGGCETCQFFQKKECLGCIDLDGERAWEGRKSTCPLCVCCKEHKVTYCGACKEFPCELLRKQIAFDKDGIEKLAALRKKQQEERLVFKELTKEEQHLFTLSWASFSEGNAPIAAMVVDRDGNILSEGRNHVVTGGVSKNPKLDHAEMQCLLELDAVKYNDPHSYTLNSTLEPCPMCMGTIVMAGIRTVQVSTRDNCGGATDICRKNTYIQTKRMKIRFDDSNLAELYIALNTYNMLQRHGEGNWAVKLFEKDYERGYALAIQMFRTREIEKLIEKGMNAEEAFSYLMDMLLAL